MIWNEIVCLGDSITYGARDEYGRSYPVELNKTLLDKTGEIYICHNYGINGETSSDLLRRAWRALKSHDGAKIALIMIGTNDTQINNPSDIYKDNLKQIINMVKIFGMKPIVATLPKLGFTPLYINNSKNIKHYNDAITSLSEELNFEICDMGGIEKYYVDNVHFTHEGNVEIARKWAKKILNIQT
ncbi:hypothetical protein CMI37_36520 [Candidatus Pacearchaeota archaeon]|nr:hypothetical protein [Candidatus Pacearchaeota archaeon]|tara:strand:- start:734 stop:1291 length:558 start_codon:yes stop_codon:yes gene_type:complete